MAFVMGNPMALWDALGLATDAHVEHEKRDCVWLILLGHTQEVFGELVKSLPFESVPCGDRFIGKCCGHEIINGLLPASCAIPGTGWGSSCPSCRKKDGDLDLFDAGDREKLSGLILNAGLPVPSNLGRASYCAMSHSADLAAIEKVKAEMRKAAEEGSDCCKSITLRVMCFPGTDSAYAIDWATSHLSGDDMTKFQPPVQGPNEKYADYAKRLEKWERDVLSKLKREYENYVSPCDVSFKVDIQETK